MSRELDVYIDKSVDGDDDAKDQSVVDIVDLILRLIVGGALEGTDELLRRLRERQQQLKQNQTTKMTVFIDADHETETEKLRYALLGALFETPGAMRRGLLNAQENRERATDLAAKLASPLTNSWLARPFRRRYQRFVARREAFIDRLVSVGRAQEQSGRLLAREVTVEALDEILSYLAQKPELREIVQQQGVSLTGEVVNELRQRTAAADSLLDRVLGRQTQSRPSSVVEMSRSDPKR